MGCGCKKQPKVQTVVMTSPEPTPVKIPQTPDELHAMEMNQWNGGNIKIQDDKEEN